VTQTHRTAEAKFRSVFDDYFDAINRYCLRRLSVDDVNDATAEVFTVAWRKIKQMPDGDDVLPWLYGVARYEINNRRRSKRRARALTDKLRGQANHPDPGPEPAIVRASELEGIVDALGKLKPDDRELLLLHTHEELDYNDIAVAFSCSPEAARKRLSRSIIRLRKAANIPEPRPAWQGIRAIERGDNQ
jgi:RNA polymerase sigma-70 factor (ECF subfamily)